MHQSVRYFVFNVFAIFSNKAILPVSITWGAGVARFCRNP
jgi:hypothetical protein